MSEQGYFYVYAESPNDVFFWLDNGHTVKDYYFEFADGRQVDFDNPLHYPMEIWVSVQGDNNNSITDVFTSFIGKLSRIFSDGNEVTSPNGSDNNNGFWGFAWFPALGKILKPFFDLIRPFIQKVLSKLQQLAKQYWWLLPLVLIILIFLYSKKRKK